MTVLVAAGAAGAGAIIGSFLNVVIHRLRPEGLLRLGSRSVCPSCGAQIAWYDNVPILSWLVLRGRGRCCGQPISVRYPLVEALMSGGTLLSAWRRGILADRPSFDTTTMCLLGADILFVGLVLPLSFIDLRDRLLPDVLTIPGIVIGILLGGLLPAIHPAGHRLDVSGNDATDGLLTSVLGAAAGAALVWTIAVAGRWWFKQDAMGFGDVKFMGFAGAFIGPIGALIAFFVGCVVGAIAGVVRMLFTRDPYIPFGPFLAVGALLTWFARDEVIDLAVGRIPRFLAETRVGQALLITFVLVSFVVLLVLRHRRK